MIKHVNFTGRRRINQSAAEIEVFDGSPRTFHAEFDFTTAKMPADAKVFLEAMCAGSSVIKRFDFGTVADRKTPKDLTLDEIEGENVFFALKVVDEADSIGKILGLAENIRPLRAGKLTVTGRQGILPIDVAPLGQEVWKLDFHEHEVFLLVNEAVPGLKDRAKWDPLFFATVYPAVVRVILGEALDRGAAVDDDDENWPTLWLRFGPHLHPEHEKPPAKLDSSDEESKEWIDKVVAEFAKSHGLKDQYAMALPQPEGDEA
jgi:hypothetical protein